MAHLSKIKNDDQAMLPLYFPSNGVKETLRSHFFLKDICQTLSHFIGQIKNFTCLVSKKIAKLVRLKRPFDWGSFTSLLGSVGGPFGVHQRSVGGILGSIRGLLGVYPLGVE